MHCTCRTSLIESWEVKYRETTAGLFRHEGQWSMNGKPIIKEPVYKKTVGMEQYSPFVAILHGTTIKLNPNAQLPDEDDPYQIKKVDISV